MSPKKRRMRRGEPLPGAATLVLHGDRLVPEELRVAAQDNFEVYGYFGVSVFVEAGPEWSWSNIAARKLDRFEWLAVFRAGDLLRTGLDLWDTGRAPHYDVVHGDLDQLVTKMLGCLHRLVRNDRHTPHEGGA